MKHYLRPVFTLAVFMLLTATSVQAAAGEKMVIALKTDDFELAEFDISELAVGEAQTIETESGTVIDILRTVDGENIFIHKEVEISCTDDKDGTACSDRVIWVSDDENVDLEELHESHQSGEGHKVIVIKKEIVSED